MQCNRHVRAISNAENDIIIIIIIVICCATVHLCTQSFIKPVFITVQLQFLILHIWVVTPPYFGTELDPELQMYTVRDLAQESNLIPIDSSAPIQRAQFVTRRI